MYWHVGALSVEAARYSSTSEFVDSAGSAVWTQVAAHASTSDSAASSRVAHACRATLQSTPVALGIGVEIFHISSRCPLIFEYM